MKTIGSSSVLLSLSALDAMAGSFRDRVLDIL